MPKVVKRTGAIVDFDGARITSAVNRAYIEVYFNRPDAENEKSAAIVTADVIAEIERMDKDRIRVEEIQDIIEKLLMDHDPTVAKAYIFYRKKHAELRAFRQSLGIEDDLKLPLNTIMVLAARYLLKDENGKFAETPKQLFRRVARAIAAAERAFGKSDVDVTGTENEFYDAMAGFRFMPNTPTLMNAGVKGGQLSACFVLPVGDSIPEIFDAIKNTAIIHQSGGGTGFAFSRLRPRGDIVGSSGGGASGPVAFMKVFDSATERIKQGGKRRGANMGILRVDHPDILDFIVAKEEEGALTNFNISVGITDVFIKAVQSNSDYDLINPKNNKVTGRLNARVVWNLIVTMAWRTGDPGLVFLDRINASLANPVPKYGPIESTNPCGEQPLYPFDSCNLGSINLARTVKRSGDHYEVDWDELRRTIRIGVRFLDDVVEVNKYPIKETETISRAIRRIGLGIMGWADMLIELGIRYDSNEALVLAERIMSFITDNARHMSEELAVERGPFQEFEDSIWARLGSKPLRNSTVTTIAPTGTISIIAGGASQGIEPIFSVVYMRNVHESLGYDLVEVNNVFEEAALKNGFFSEELMKKLAGRVSIQDVEEIPEAIRKLFITAYDIGPEWHIKMQAAFQKHTDNAVSKTINFPNYATPQDIERAYWLAYQMGCKGITIYRDGSKSVQVLQKVDNQQGLGLKGIRQQHAVDKDERVLVEQLSGMASTYTFVRTRDSSCPQCSSKMIASEGCFTCPKCGFSSCG